MRQFKIKNLLIQVLPKEGEILAQLLADCTGCSLNITDYTKGCCGGGCSNQPSGVCLPCTDITKPKIELFNPADLAILKAQLEIALQEVQVRERLIAERLRIQTRAEANLVEQELTKALEEVKTIKVGLSSEPNTRKK